MKNGNMTENSKGKIAAWFENAYALKDSKTIDSLLLKIFSELKFRKSKMDLIWCNILHVAPWQILGIIFLFIFLYFQFLKM